MTPNERRDRLATDWVDTGDNSEKHPVDVYIAGWSARDVEVAALVEALERVVKMTRETPCLPDGVIQQCRETLRRHRGKP